jgi:hypothetical protein
LTAIIEARNWLESAKKERNSQGILNSLTNLENTLYKGKLTFGDINTGPREIRRLKEKAYKMECNHWLLTSKRNNNLEAIQKYEAYRKKGGFSYKATGTSQTEIKIRKFIAKIF